METQKEKLIEALIANMIELKNVYKKLYNNESYAENASTALQIGNKILKELNIENQNPLTSFKQ